MKKSTAPGFEDFVTTQYICLFSLSSPLCIRIGAVELTYSNLLDYSGENLCTSKINFH